MNTKNKELRVGFWNKGGFWGAKLKTSKHINELKYQINKQKTDVLVVCEANATHEDLEKMKIPGYEYKYGSVGLNRIIIIHRNYLVINEIVSHEEIPTICITVKYGTENIRIIGLYREFKKIGTRTRTIQQETDIFNEFMKSLENEFRNKQLIFCGDMNLNWQELDNERYSRKTMLKTLAEKTMGMTQIVTAPTRNTRHTQTMIDLCFVKGVKHTDAIVEETINSDHCFIQTSIITNVTSPKKTIQKKL